MALITVKPAIYLKGKSPEKPATIVIRVTHGRKSKYLKTPFQVLVKDFDIAKGEVKNTCPDYEYYNLYLQKKVNEIKHKSILRTIDGNFTLADIKDHSNNNRSFTGLVEAYIKEVQLSNKRKPGTIVNYRKSLNKFQMYLGKKDILLSEITPETLSGYEAFLIAKGNQNNTIADSITKFFSKFIRLAKNKGYWGELKDPFIAYEARRENAGGRTYLTIDEVDAIEKLLPTLDKSYQQICAFFLVACYSGLRHSDWQRFKLEKLIKNDSLQVRAKKNGEPVYISLNNRPRLKAILAYIQANNLTANFTLEYANRALKLIAALAGINKRLSTHYGRFTAATLHLELGFTKEYVAEMLGVTMRVVDRYAKVTRTKMNNEDAIRQGL